MADWIGSEIEDELRFGGVSRRAGVWDASLLVEFEARVGRGEELLAVCRFCCPLWVCLQLVSLRVGLSVCSASGCCWSEDFGGWMVRGEEGTIGSDVWNAGFDQLG